jgi:hypothetical protein
VARSCEILDSSGRFLDKTEARKSGNAVERVCEASYGGRVGCCGETFVSYSIIFWLLIRFVWPHQIIDQVTDN